VAAHSLRECRRAMARRRGQFAGPWVSGHTDACMHVGVGGRWDRFSTIEKRRRECAGCRAQSARVPQSDGATARAGCRTLGYPVTPMLACMLAWAVDGTDFRPSRSGGGSVRAAAHGLRECRGAMERRRGQVAGPWGIRSHRCLHACWRGRSMGPIFDRREAAAGVCGLPRTVCESAGERWSDGAGRLPGLKISAPSVVARMLVWARDATDFRPSINGVGGACASRRTVCERGRERWRDLAGRYRTSRFRPCRSLHACWRGRATRPIFVHR
jgi:hypothetical protein